MVILMSALRVSGPAARAGFSCFAFLAFLLSPAGADELASHRAAYDLELVRSETSADIAGLDGRMVLEWSGTACEGYTLTQRLVTRIYDTDGGLMVRDMRMTSWESGEGDTFRFEVQRYVDSKLEETVSGMAERGADGAYADFSSPKAGRLLLPERVLFPSEFVRDLVSAAEKDEKLVTATVFEGAEIDRYFDVSAFIGRRSVAETDLSALEGEGAALGNEPSWPVQVSYFLPTDPEGLPDYQVSYRLFSNGVSSDMKLDYGDVVVQGKLTSLEFLIQDPC